jgi:hypothetical protein
MRTTIVLSAETHAEAKRVAAAENLSMASFLGGLVEQGIRQRAQAISVSVSPKTGLPVFQLPGSVTAAQAARMVDEDA